MVGLDNLKFIHLNDSKMDIGSRFDIHEFIGLGKIGVEGLETIINHKSLRFAYGDGNSLYVRRGSFREA